MKPGERLTAGWTAKKMINYESTTAIGQQHRDCEETQNTTAEAEIKIKEK